MVKEAGKCSPLRKPATCSHPHPQCLPKPTMTKEIVRFEAHPRSVPVITKKPSKDFRDKFGRTAYEEDEHEQVGRSACAEVGRSGERLVFEEEQPEGPPPDEEPFVFEELECSWLQKMFLDELKLNHERKFARSSLGMVIADCSGLHRRDAVCQFCDVVEQSTEKSHEKLTGRGTEPSESFRKYQEALLRPLGQKTSEEAPTVIDIAKEDPECYCPYLW